MQSPKWRRSTKTTKKRQTSKEDAFRLKAEPLLEALDSAIFQLNKELLVLVLQFRKPPKMLPEPIDIGCFDNKYDHATFENQGIS